MASHAERFGDDHKRKDLSPRHTDRYSTSRSPKRQRPQTSPTPTRPSSTADEPFVWKKKVEKQRKQGVNLTAASERDHLQHLQDELAEAQRQRAQRDAERLQMEARIAQEARRNEQERNVDARHADELFIGRQHFARQALRLRQHRPIPVDLLAQVIRLDIPEPQKNAQRPLPSSASSASSSQRGEVLEIISTFPKSEIPDLLQAIETELDYIPDYPTEEDNDISNRAIRLQFWTCVQEVLRDQVANEQQSSDPGVHSSVSKEMDALLNGKDIKELREMESEISTQMRSVGEDQANSAFGEVDFWTTALRRIRASLAAHTLKRIEVDMSIERRRRESEKKSGDGGEAPKDMATSSKRDSEQVEEDMVRAEAAKGMEEDEEAFLEEVKDASTSQRARTSNSDGYHSRKPRYFNRVHTGYKWSKYNRTHYDHDNPPPKTVQGYKFNIFYPELMDGGATPTYKMRKTENPDVSIITFSAGAPYEDLSFKIVNRPWERSHKRGFRCSFDRGVLQLWFYFQRYRYRR